MEDEPSPFLSENQPRDNSGNFRSTRIRHVHTCNGQKTEGTEYEGSRTIRTASCEPEGAAKNSGKPRTRGKGKTAGSALSLPLTQSGIAHGPGQPEFSPLDSLVSFHLLQGNTTLKCTYREKQKERERERRLLPSVMEARNKN